MLKKVTVRAGLLFGLMFTTLLHGQEERKAPTIDWKSGPVKVSLGSQAEIDLPTGYVFADGADSRKIMEYFGNQPTDLEQGYIEPADNSDWYVIFEFEDSGYIKADGEELDADALFKSLQEGSKAGNEWRREHGLPELTLVSWHEKPHYDPKTNNLEWGTVNESEGQNVINYNIRLLGREGVMSATIVASPEKMTQAITATKSLLQKYDFKGGKKYSEWREGDKIAEYGLAALITGGAVVAASKSGLLSKFWKLIVVGIAATGGLLKTFWKKITGKQ